MPPLPPAPWQGFPPPPGNWNLCSFNEIILFAIFQVHFKWIIFVGFFQVLFHDKHSHRQCHQGHRHPRSQMVLLSHLHHFRIELNHLHKMSLKLPFEWIIFQKNKKQISYKKNKYSAFLFLIWSESDQINKVVQERLYVSKYGWIEAYSQKKTQNSQMFDLVTIVLNLKSFPSL